MNTISPRQRLTVDWVAELSSVDFSDIAEIDGSASLIAAMASDIGMFSTSAHDVSGQKRLITASRHWLAGAEASLCEMAFAGQARIIDRLDLVHRIAFRRPVDTEMINRCKLAAFDAHRKGDPSVDRHDLHDAVTVELRKRNAAFFGAPLRWHSETTARWLDLMKSCPRDASSPDYRSMRRAATLLQSDLWAFLTTDEAGFKRELAQKALHALTRLPDSADLATLNAAQGLYSATRPYLPATQAAATEARIIAAIVNHPATNRFARQSLLLQVNIPFAGISG